MLFLKFRQYFSYLIDKYLLKGSTLRVVNGYLEIERRPRIDLSISLPHGTTEYDPTKIIEKFLYKFNHESDDWTYGGSFYPKPFIDDAFLGITPSVHMVSKQKISGGNIMFELSRHVLTWHDKGIYENAPTLMVGFSDLL